MTPEGRAQERREAECREKGHANLYNWAKRQTVLRQNTATNPRTDRFYMFCHRCGAVPEPRP